MMKLTIGHCGLIRPLLLIALLVPIVIIPNLYPQSLSASEADLKPGDTIGAHNWDDYKTGGGTAEGKIVRHAIEKHGSERRAAVIHHSIKTRGRVHLDAKPVLPGYDHSDWMQLPADEYPRDTAGTTTLEIRYPDPK